MKIVIINLSDEIRKCTRCVDHGLASSDRLKTHQKPYIQFDVKRRWKPDRVKVLFIAESPPWNREQRYFYNPDFTEKRTNLRKEVLKNLNLSTLEEFKDKGYFLIDTIKCRLNKRKKIKAPLRITRISKICAEQFLWREIEELNPHTIFVLGNTAKKTLQRFSEFKELKEQNVSKDYNGNLLGYHVILCVFPGGQTRKYRNEIKCAFAKIQQQ